MKKNYLTYPCKVMNITQGYTGSYSHAGHINGTPKDYPIDEACNDTGRDWFYCPCDEMRIARIYGVGASATNTIWLESTTKVVTPSGEDFVTILICHPNDDDLKKLSKGQKFKRGQQIFREGTDGKATGNHFHMSVGFGKFVGTGWVQNSKGSWVNKTTGAQLKPEKAFYIDPSFTKVKNKKGLAFANMPKETEIDKQYVVTGTGSSLNVRSGPGTSHKVVAAYADGTIIKASKKSDNWVYVNNKGWCSLAYLEEYVEPVRVPGDIDGDGKVTASDARLALRAAVGLEKLTAEQIKAGDIDGDGGIGAADAREILRLSVGMK